MILVTACSNISMTNIQYMHTPRIRNVQQLWRPLSTSLALSHSRLPCLSQIKCGKKQYKKKHAIIATMAAFQGRKTQANEIENIQSLLIDKPTPPPCPFANGYIMQHVCMYVYLGNVNKTAKKKRLQFSFNRQQEIAVVALEIIARHIRLRQITYTTHKTGNKNTNKTTQLKRINVQATHIRTHTY